MKFSWGGGGALNEGANSEKVERDNKKIPTFLIQTFKKLTYENRKGSDYLRYRDGTQPIYYAMCFTVLHHIDHNTTRVSLSAHL